MEKRPNTVEVIQLDLPNGDKYVFRYRDREHLREFVKSVCDAYWAKRGKEGGLLYKEGHAEMTVKQMTEEEFAKVSTEERDDLS